MKQNLLVILGPTASGKTSLGLDLGQKINGELVSFDSRQVYRGMDIGTGKDVGESKFTVWQKRGNYQLGYYLVDGLPIWLTDIVSPSFDFSAADYVNCARPVLTKIWQSGKLPILVGGTGFYLRALLGEVETLGVKPRRWWRAWVSTWSTSKLQKRLAKVDPSRWSRMNESDRANPRRLIRALEVASQKKKNPRDDFQFDRLVKIGLRWSLPTLDSRIEARVQARMQAGQEEEVRQLAKKLGWCSALTKTIGYQEWREYLAGKISRSEVISQWQNHEKQYARRQLTWLRREKDLVWFEGEKLKLRRVLTTVKTFLPL